MLDQMMSRCQGQLLLFHFRVQLLSPCLNQGCNEARRQTELSFCGQAGAKQVLLDNPISDPFHHFADAPV